MSQPDFATIPASPSPAPATPETAAAQLAQRMADQDWREKVLSGNGPEVRELDELLALKGKDTIDRLIDGTYQPQPFEVNVDGMSSRNTMEYIGWLREAGIGDAVLRQVLEGSPIPKAERRAVEQMRADKFTDPAWTKRLLAGGAAEKRELLLINIVMSQPEASA